MAPFVRPEPLGERTSNGPHHVKFGETQELNIRIDCVYAERAFHRVILRGSTFPHRWGFVQTNKHARFPLFFSPEAF